MALQKSIENESGIDVTYWRITVVTIDDLNGKAEVQLWGWITEAKRRNGNAHACVMQYILTEEELPGMNIGVNKVKLYDIIKKKLEFLDSIDV